jgi:hypothetical protein
MKTACTAALALVAAVAFSSSAHADDAPRGGLAVLGFECSAPSSTCAAIESEVRSALQRTGRFPIVERERTAEVLREIAVGHTPSFDENTAVEVGRMLAARYVCFGTIGPASIAETRLEKHVGLRAYVTVSMRVVSAERGSVIFETAVTETREGWRNITPEEVLYMEAGRQAVAEIARQFANKVESQGYVVEVMPDRRLLIDLGREQGVVRGAVFAVFRPGGSALGADGRSVPRPDVVVGAIRIEQVGSTSSVARCVKGEAPAPGDRVVSQQKRRSTWDW